MRINEHPGVQAIAARQAGTIRTNQMPADVTPAQVRAAIDAGLWQRVASRVVVTTNAPLTQEQRVWVASLAGPSRAALGGPTAAQLDGMRTPFRRTDERVHLVIPHAYRRPAVEAEVHWSTKLDDMDVWPTREPRRTRLARSVLDWASWLPQDDDQGARVVVLSAVQQRLVTPADLRDHHRRRGHNRHHALIEESIDDAAGGVQSLPEWEVTRLVREGGLPRPSHQVRRERPDGSAFYDVGWDQYRCYAEIEGARHFLVENREADLDRHNDLVVRGERILYFSSFAVRRRRCLVLEHIVRALRAGGWTGEACMIIPPSHVPPDATNATVCTCGRVEHHLR